MGRLCQGVGTGKNGKGKIIEGTNTFFTIKFEDIPKDRLNEICYTSVVCEVRPGKKDPNRTRITICGTNVCYPGDVGTNMASLELFKLMINSMLSRKGAKYVCFDIENFYLSTHLGRPEYVKIQLSKSQKNAGIYPIAIQLYVIYICNHLSSFQGISCLNK